MEMPGPEYDAGVIIVGGGPVGPIAAIDLDRRGISSVVIETHTFPHAPNVKCNHISSRTMERFRQLRIAEAVRGAGLPADSPQDVAFRTGVAGREFARIRISPRNERLTSPGRQLVPLPGVDEVWCRGGQRRVVEVSGSSNEEEQRRRRKIVSRITSGVPQAHWRSL